MMKNLIRKLKKLSLYFDINSMSDYDFFRFCMYILGILGWILFFMKYI